MTPKKQIRSFNPDLTFCFFSYVFLFENNGLFHSLSDEILSIRLETHNWQFRWVICAKIQSFLSLETLVGSQMYVSFSNIKF